MSKATLLLPLTVRATYLMAVIGKLAGEPRELVDQDGAIQVRFTGTQGPLPSLRLNAAPLPGADPLSRVLVSFRAADGMRRNWEFYPEMEDEAGKVLSMEDTPLAMAIAARLCQVFGGSLLKGGASTPIVHVAPANAFWQPGTSPGQQHRFQDFLAQLPALTRQELAIASEQAADASADADAIRALSAATALRPRTP